ncbi:MAG: DUF4974 domain-containing protein [Flavobacteriaceae bacterium]|nr:DUF4974 domain-containing protein [Flavobacteriaceae bacterium]
MKMNLKNIVKKLASDKCTKEEISFLETYLKSNELEELEKLIHDTWNSDAIKNISKHKEDHIWLQIQSKILEKGFNKNNQLIKRYKNKKRYALLKYAAIFIGITLSSVVFYKYTNKVEPTINQVTIEFDDGTTKIIRQTTQQFMINADGTIIAQQKEDKLLYNDIENDVSNEKLVFNTLRVPYGKKFQVVLSDGSQVYLNSGSSLKYPVKFIKGNSREVFLEGEGYFTVAKNKNDFFIVNTNDISTKVFGTQFNISSYDNEASIKVVLVEGSVSVYKTMNADDDDLQNNLKPNQIASYVKAEQKINTDQVDISSHIAWIDGVLLFKNENFNTIIRKLERHYDVSIVNKNTKLKNERFTGRFEIENIDEVLNTFKRTITFSYKKDKNNIIINP